MRNLFTTNRNSWVIGLILLTIILSAYVVFVPVLPADATSGLIKCGLQNFTSEAEEAFCSICDLIALIQDLLDRAILVFAAPIAALMLGYGGFLLVIAGIKGGDAAAYGQGKKVLTNTVIGIIILLASWILIDTLLKSIGAYDYASTKKFGPWNKIECTSPALSFPRHAECVSDTCTMVKGVSSVEGCTMGDPKNCANPPQHLDCDFTAKMCKYVPGSGSNKCAEGEDPKCNTKYHKCVETSCVEAEGPPGQPDECAVLGDNNPSCRTSAAYQINADNAKLIEGRVNFSGSADCDGKSAQTNFRELLNKESLTVCHDGCEADRMPCTKQGFTANNRMLVDLKNLIDKYDFKGISVSSISTGDHTSNSDHYKGYAVDIQSLDKTKYKDLRNQLRSFNPDSPYLECEGKSGIIKSCGEGTNHVHVTYP